MKISILLTTLAVLCCHQIVAENAHQFEVAKTGKLKKDYYINNPKECFAQISNVLIEWENVKEHMEKGHSMLNTNDRRYPREAKWIQKFDHELLLLGGSQGYIDWLFQFFNDLRPMDDATVEMIAEMTLFDLRNWITYLERYNRWAEPPYTVVIDEIENGRMEALIENLRGIYHINGY